VTTTTVTLDSDGVITTAAVLPGPRAGPVPVTPEGTRLTRWH